MIDLSYPTGRPGMRDITGVVKQASSNDVIGQGPLTSVVSSILLIVTMSPVAPVFQPAVKHSRLKGEKSMSGSASAWYSTS